MTSEYRAIAAPMHGQAKLANEGYRTRDGHIIEWFGRLLADQGPVAVISRPEPFLRLPQYSRHQVADNTIPIDTRSWRVPNPIRRRAWWVSSARDYPVALFQNGAPAITWNPFLFGALSRRYPDVSIDLLDDWTIHYAFATIRPAVERAYARAFECAPTVFANSEGTAALAARFGRDDVILLPNGTDPERFDLPPSPRDKTTIGYVGKIGKRVDLDLVLRTASALADWHFVFAGPILDREYLQPLARVENIELLGDVHYERVPQLLASFDVGWVPHRVGQGEVGGDVIKTYEYRAAGLPVLSTPIAGVRERGLGGVSVVAGDLHVDWLQALPRHSNRVARVPGTIPLEHTWSHKARRILRTLGATVD